MWRPSYRCWTTPCCPRFRVLGEADTYSRSLVKSSARWKTFSIPHRYTLHLVGLPKRDGEVINVIEFAHIEQAQSPRRSAQTKGHQRAADRDHSAMRESRQLPPFVRAAAVVVFGPVGVGQNNLQFSDSRALERSARHLRAFAQFR